LLLLLSMALAQPCSAAGEVGSYRTWERLDLGPGELHTVCLRGEVDYRPVSSAHLFLHRQALDEEGPDEERIDASLDDRGCATVCVPPGRWRATAVNGSKCLMSHYREATTSLLVKADRPRTWYVRMPSDGWPQVTLMRATDG